MNDFLPAVPLAMDEESIRRLLPHRGMWAIPQIAYVNDLLNPTQATGHFTVCGDDPRIKDHFGIMPGVLMAEFAHQIGAIIIAMKKPEMMPILKESHPHILGFATHGDKLFCTVDVVDASHKRDVSFSGVILNDRGVQILSITFTGSAIRREVFEKALMR